MTPIVSQVRVAEMAAGRGVLNALTVDVEDYYHVSAFDGQIPRSCWEDFQPRGHIGLARILGALDEAGVRGTFFFLGWLAERQPALVRQVHELGHEVGCHSYWHRLVYRQSPDEFRADLRRARAVLEDITGTPVTTYRAPSFSITRRSLWALDILIEEGFALDSSIYPIVHDRYGIPGTPARPHRLRREAGEIVEFPAPAVQILGLTMPVGGGGYFRLYPYWCTRYGLRRLNRAGRPAAVYLHPWEFDTDQPRVACSRATAFRHYVGLKRTHDRLQRLLGDFALGTITDAAGRFAETYGLHTFAPSEKRTQLISPATTASDTANASVGE
jgi:polysaccharide deacetylase family protein (PEP-CTERM system associated)